MDASKFGAAVRTTAQTSGMIFLIFIGADMINASLALSVSNAAAGGAPAAGVRHSF